MAKQGAKKRKEENSRHMTFLLRLIVACNVIYIVGRMFIFYSSLSWAHVAGLLFTSAVYAFSYQQLLKMANPTYGDDGELLDGGFDMSTGGLCSYLHDVIYITSFVQLMSIISDKFWYTYFLIIGFIIYQLVGFAKRLLPRGSQGEMEDEKTRKKREKMERKASRGKFVKTKTR